MNAPFTRRQFLKRMAATTATFYIAQSSWAKDGSPNEKLNLAFVGVGGMQGGYNVDQFAPLKENVVGLCDVDANFLAAAAKKFPEARTYRDFRRLLEQRDLDAVVVTTPDHSHAVITAAVLRSGRHVYCEKPLTHTISEVRTVEELARRHHRVTQMGTQIHAGDNYRRVVELIQSGTIGPVREAHVWMDGSWESKPRPKPEPVPATLDYELWLGPVPFRPYSAEYVPCNWRRWWHFGGGTLSDFGCHYMDLAFWALKLGHPLTVEAEGPPVDPECAPPWCIVRYEFPARENLPPVKLTWYHGGKRPPLPDAQRKDWGAGLLFIGEKGSLCSDYGRHQLLPEKDWEGFTPPKPFIPNSIGHYKEWTEACKTGGPTTCNFAYAGPLTETVLLGHVAYRLGEKLDWNAARGRAANDITARRLIEHQYRAGWHL